MTIAIGTKVIARDPMGVERHGEIVANPIEPGMLGHGLPMVKWRGPHNMSSDRCTVYEHDIIERR